MSEFEVKDSGERQSFAGGMVRDIEEGKTDYTLILDGPMLERWAEHLTKGAVKYAARNWMLATADEEARFKRSALRHMLQWLKGERDEDHAAAVYFNINGAEYAREQLPTFDEAVDAARHRLRRGDIPDEYLGVWSTLEDRIREAEDRKLREIEEVWKPREHPTLIEATMEAYIQAGSSFEPFVAEVSHDMLEKIRDMVIGDDDE